jgi:hypothetical protein
MAYNNGFPMSYQQMYPQYIPSSFQPQMMQQQPQMTQQVNDTGILWVQGEAGAKSWAVAPGKSVMLMDSESNTFYIKSSDNSGMPMPLRIFDYTERTNQSTQPVNVIQHEQIDTSQFITKEELEKRLSEFVQRSEVE